jgi:hypothetical protein
MRKPEAALTSGLLIGSQTEQRSEVLAPPLLSLPINALVAPSRSEPVLAKRASDVA